MTDGNDGKIVAANLGDPETALGFLAEHEGETLLEDVDEKQLMRKVDWRLMPLMLMCYYLQYTDKTLINYAALMGIVEDTNMPENGFSHLAMVFYISFLVFEPLQAAMSQRLPTAKWLGANVIVWGIICSCNCAVTNYASVVALRVILGCLEASTAPCLINLTSMWYTRPEQTVRMGIWYQGTSVGPAISSLVSFGFLHYTNSHPEATFRAWQIMFLVFGIITIVTGILILVVIPDSPMESNLTPAQKIVIINRVRANQTGIENKNIKWRQIREVLLDIRTWFLACIVILTNVPNGAVSSFSSQIISNFGYDDYQSLLLNLPAAAVAFISVAAASSMASKFNARSISIVLLIVPTLIGGALMAWLSATDKAGLLAGNYLTFTVGSSLPLIYSWISANYAGNTKKTTMSAIVLISFCIGNIIGPLTFQAKDAPAYIPAKITIVATLAAAMVLTVILALLYHLENKRRDGVELSTLPRDFDLLDLTDKENNHFRYVM